jgi:hypothetical protein
MSSTFNPRGSGDWSQAFTRAETYLGNKGNRPLQNNTRLIRADADAIAVVLHNTAVVTYRRDGTFVIYGGGWNSVTTKDRIRGWSPANPHSDGSGGWVVGYTGELTAARVQKCRSCKGRGRWMAADYCYGRTYAPHAVDGMWRHETRPCEHGQTERHATGESERVCYRCDGAGRVDYGSKPVPVTVTASDPFTVDSSGTYRGLADVVHAPSNGYPPSKSTTYSGWNYVPAASTPDTYGAELVDSLAAVLPDIRARVANPVSGLVYELSSVVIDLNDSRGWTREQIADWLDTLDLDLRFPVDVGTD